MKLELSAPVHDAKFPLKLCRQKLTLSVFTFDGGADCISPPFAVGNGFNILLVIRGLPVDEVTNTYCPAATKCLPCEIVGMKLLTGTVVQLIQIELGSILLRSVKTKRSRFSASIGSN